MNDLSGDELLQAFVDQYIDGAQGCHMEFDDAQALAVAIKRKLNPYEHFDMPVSETMDLDTPIGSMVRYMNKNGHVADRDAANSVLTANETYEVLDLEVGGFYSRVRLDHGWFNTVMFENVEED